MFNTFKALFDQLTHDLAAPADTAGGTPSLALSTAVLLVEVMRADPVLTDSERRRVIDALRRKFSLGEDETGRLLEAAQETARTAYDYQRFTHLLNERFSQPQKVAVIEAMWEVAYADGHLDVYENAVISKVAGLLHVTHGEYIAAKLHAQQTVRDAVSRAHDAPHG